MTDARTATLAALAALALVLVLAPTAPAAERSDDAAPMLDRLAELERWYAENPELTERKGSGWKPYHRYKWFHEQRLVNGELPAPDARWNAWQEKQRRERLLPRGGASWFALGPANFAGRMLAIAFDPVDPATVYAGAAGGGLWKTADGGDTWTPLTDELPSLAVGGVAVSPLDPDVVVIGTGEGTFNIDRISGVGILRSTDAGATWSTTSLSYAESAGHGFHFVRANPITGTLLAGATDGLYRSTDEGVTWAQVKSGGNYFDAHWKPGDANRVYTVRGSCNCGGANVKVSTDDGLTWDVAGTGQPPGTSIGKAKLALSPADPAAIAVIFVNRSTSGLLGVYRSTDEGATWGLQSTTPNIPGGQGWYNLSLAADPDDATRLIAGGIQLYRSTDAGVTWTGIGGNVHVDHHDAVWEPGNGDAVWVATDGGLWRSTNDGTAWTGRNDGLVTYQFYDICVNNNPDTPYYVMGGTQDNGTDKWSGTTTWSEGLFADGMVCNINPVNGTTVYAEIQFGSHYKNFASGSGSWTAINSGLGGSGAWVTPVDEDQNVGNRLFTSTSAGIYETTNGGNLWTNVAGHTARWISISSVDGNVVWTTGSSTRVTTDGGSTWTRVDPFPFPIGTPTKILAHPTDAATALVTFSGYSAATAHVGLTTDLGATWTDVSGDLPAQPVNAVVVDPDRPEDWYVGTDVGVWKSVNGGANWMPVDAAGFPNTVVVDLEIARPVRKLVAGTHGRGAWELDIPLATTDATVALGESPGNLLLDPPSPNPIRDRTLLRFAAHSRGPVTLAVYDVRGRLVTPVEELPEAGGREVGRPEPELPSPGSFGLLWLFVICFPRSRTISVPPGLTCPSARFAPPYPHRRYIRS